MNAPPVGPAPALQSSQATLREFMAVVFRRRWVILGLFFAVTATVLAIAFTTPKIWASSGRVLVARGGRESALTPRWQIMNDWEQDLASEVAKAKSTVVMQRTRDELDRRARRTNSKPLPFNIASVDVEVMGKSNVLAIGYSDLNPEVAQEVCDALLNAYVEFRQDKNIGSSDSLFSNEIERINTRIETLLAERQALSTRSGVIVPLDQSRDWSSQISFLEGRREEAQADLVEAQAAVQAMKELQRNPELDLPTLGVPTTNENTLVGLKEKITLQQARIAQLRERYRDDSPDVQAALGTLETLQALLHKEVDNRLTMAKARLDVLKARLDVHANAIEDLRVRLAAMPANEKALGDIDAEVRTLRTRYEDYLKARDQARITASVSQNINVTLLNPAGTPTPQNTRDYVRLALAPVFSLVVGIGLAFFLDGLDLTVRTSGQAEEYLEMPVLATVSERRRRR